MNAPESMQVGVERPSSEWLAKRRKKKRKKRKRGKRRSEKKPAQKSVEPEAKGAAVPSDPSGAKPSAEEPSAESEPSSSKPNATAPSAVAASPSDGSELQDERPGIAALDLVAVKGVDKAVARLLNEVMLSRLRASGRFSSILGSSDIQAMLTAEQRKAVVGCDDDSCLSQLGGALGVPLLFSADVGVVGGRFLLNLKILQVEEARVLNRTSGVFADEAALLDGLDSAVDQLVVGALSPASEETTVAPELAKAEAPDPPVRANGQPSRRRLLRAGLVAGVGALLSASSAIYFSGAQEAFDDTSRPTVGDVEELSQAADRANAGLVVGLAILGLGGVLAW